MTHHGWSSAERALLLCCPKVPRFARGTTYHIVAGTTHQWRLLSPRLPMERQGSRRAGREKRLGGSLALPSPVSITAQDSIGSGKPREASHLVQPGASGDGERDVAKPPYPQAGAQLRVKRTTKPSSIPRGVVCTRPSTTYESMSLVTAGRVFRPCTIQRAARGSGTGSSEAGRT